MLTLCFPVKHARGKFLAPQVSSLLPIGYRPGGDVHMGILGFSNSGPAIRLMVAGVTGHSKTVIGEVIMHYLVAIHHPDDYDPAIAEDEEMGQVISTCSSKS